MEYLKEADVLCDEELCGRIVEEESVEYKAAELFRNNVRLVYHIAKNFKNSCFDNSIDYDDILSTGYEGLWRACLGFDESKGFQFSTYAVSWIKGYILRLLRDTECIKTPRWFKDVRYVMKSHGLTIPLSESDIQLILDKGVATREQLNNYQHLIISSLEYSLDDEEESTLGDVVADTSIAELGSLLSDEELEVTVNRLLIYLHPSHRDIVEEWIYSEVYDSKVGQRELAKKYNTSQPRVSKIIKKSIEVFNQHKDEILDLVV